LPGWRVLGDHRGKSGSRVRRKPAPWPGGPVTGIGMALRARLVLRRAIVRVGVFRRRLFSPVLLFDRRMSRSISAGARRALVRVAEGPWRGLEEEQGAVLHAGADADAMPSVIRLL